jgi:hypothetical protein
VTRRWAASARFAAFAEQSTDDVAFVRVVVTRRWAASARFAAFARESTRVVDIFFLLFFSQGGTFLWADGTKMKFVVDRKFEPYVILSLLASIYLGLWGAGEGHVAVVVVAAVALAQHTHTHTHTHTRTRTRTRIRTHTHTHLILALSTTRHKQVHRTRIESCWLGDGDDQAHAAPQGNSSWSQLRCWRG